MSFEPDAVIDAYKNGLDLTLIDEALKRSHEERLRALEEFQHFAEELRSAGRRHRGEND